MVEKKEKSHTEIIEEKVTENVIVPVKKTKSKDQNDITNLAPLQSETKEISKLKDENKLLQEQIEKTNEMLNMLKQQILNSNFNAPEKKERVSTIGCRLFNGGSLSSLNGDIIYDFRCGEEIDIDETDLKVIFKNHLYNNKFLFIKGMFYFVNEEDYDYYKIKRTVDLSEDYIINCLTELDYNSCIAEFARITKQGSDYNVKNTLLFQIALILINKPLALETWGYEHRANVEKYFNVKFDELSNTVRFFNEKVGRN